LDSVNYQAQGRIVDTVIQSCINYRIPLIQYQLHVGIILDSSKKLKGSYARNIYFK
jgi:hypothetical protein